MPRAEHLKRVVDRLRAAREAVAEAQAAERRVEEEIRRECRWYAADLTET